MKEVDSGVGQGSIYLQVRDHLCYGGGEATGGWGGVQTHCPKKLFNSIWKNLHEGGEIVKPKIKNNFVSVTTALHLCDIRGGRHFLKWASREPYQRFLV